MNGTHIDRRSSSQGFTLVELLIVIVIIAILAAVSVVAYNGITARAHDSAVQSDLASFAKKAAMYHAAEGVYPPATTAGLREGLSVDVTKGSYQTDIYNLYYCTNSGDREDFSILARSKSGKTFYNSSRGSGRVSGDPRPAWGSSCRQIGLDSLDDVQFSYGYVLSSESWSSWASSN